MRLYHSALFGMCVCSIRLSVSFYLSFCLFFQDDTGVERVLSHLHSGGCCTGCHTHAHTHSQSLLGTHSVSERVQQLKIEDEDRRVWVIKTQDDRERRCSGRPGWYLEVWVTHIDMTLKARGNQRHLKEIKKIKCKHCFFFLLLLLSVAINGWVKEPSTEDRDSNDQTQLTLLCHLCGAKPLVGHLQHEKPHKSWLFYLTRARSHPDKSQTGKWANKHGPTVSADLHGSRTVCLSEGLN